MFTSNKMVIGVDEVGKGSWAGPMLVVALAAPVNWSFAVKDSKQYTGSNAQKKHEARKKVYNLLTYDQSIVWCVRYAEAQYIDEIGMGAAHAQTISDAVEVCMNMLVSLHPGIPERIIIDGNGPQPMQGVECIPKADALFPQVSAASVIAKVLHDDQMILYALKHPGYDFESNMGYGTEKHEAGLVTHGLCPIHRRSFQPMKNYLSVPQTGLSSSCGPGFEQGEDSADHACPSEPARGYGRGAARRGGKARKGTRRR
jgi:ribonuclease HII